MTYKHGVYASQVPTALLPPTRISAGLAVVVGTAPVHMLASGQTGPVNEPVLAYNYAEAAAAVGYHADWSKYTLCEFIYATFGLYSVGPVVLINVFDPDVHKTAVADEAHDFDSADLITLTHEGPVGAATVTDSTGETTYVENTDWQWVSKPAGTIKRLAAGAIAAEESVLVDYSYGDPSLVDADDIIGGVDAGTGAYTGLFLVDRVFPKFRLVPGFVAAPGWSHASAVAAAMTARAESVNGLFTAMAVIDIDDTVATKYSDVPAQKAANNLTDPVQILGWPKVKLGDDTYHMSTHIACLLAATDGDNDDVPVVSASNQNFQMDAAAANGAEVWLDLAQANYLNGQGVVTALNWIGGWKCWGNRTAVYPDSTDVKDAFVPVRRMFNWVGNTLTTTFWAKLDSPVRRRLIEAINDSAQMWLDGLTARQFLLGGRVEFQDDENVVSDLMDGIIRFHVYMTPPSPAREIDFIQEYDPAYFETLFA
jgi:phage tail sheath protein FI